MEDQILFNRLNSTSIIDTVPPTFKNKQGKPLISLVLLNRATLNNNTIYNNLNITFQKSRLVFTEYGSLYDIEYPDNRQYHYFSSPFDPKHPEITILRAGEESVINIENKKDIIFRDIKDFPSSAKESMSIFEPANTFISRQNGKWMLNVVQLGDKSKDIESNTYEFKIYFNPINNQSISALEIGKNMNRYCNLINNLDPMCFCRSDDICTNSVFIDSLAYVKGKRDQKAVNKANKVKQTRPTDYGHIKNSCKCLNNKCRWAMLNEDNAYVKDIKCPVEDRFVCDNLFEYKDSVVGIVDHKNQNISQACGVEKTPDYSQIKKNQEEDPLPEIYRRRKIIASVIIYMCILVWYIFS